jgi:hypothetical protein
MPRKPKSRRINVDTRERWKQILKTVTKDEVPISLLEKIHVNLIDGSQVEIDIVELISEGHDPDQIKDELNERLRKMDEIIKDVDFFISIETVAKTVQPVTDDILKQFT